MCASCAAHILNECEWMPTGGFVEVVVMVTKQMMIRLMLMRVLIVLQMNDANRDV